MAVRPGRIGSCSAPPPPSSRYFTPSTSYSSVVCTCPLNTTISRSFAYDAMTLWGFCGSGIGPMPERQKAGAWKGDEHLADASGLGFAQPLLQLLHLRFVLGPISIPRRWRPIVIFAGPQEDETSAAEIKLVDQFLVGNPELLQVWKSLQQALDVGVVPHFMISHCGKNPTWQSRGAHLLVRGLQLLQYVLVD